ncbi:DTW domain-containing protein [Vibrio sp. UCD-FRSSP16_10]|uniref:tRNA-uridine aminocarboxypropyltransferase n=1 Tax=unclassified Vibrio TaxID=2614977 RepID=UPI0007FBD4E5|nr:MULTISPECIES: DTW domain-containing protein [unclassified Vibrio]OBT16031.1 DTW domain-containing protein [Vibrio sp. UCD-FRSSP16_30]OBT21113.1 DTW domain-containing protein [Vibrio sp. UCD-FRSSP16_10]
MSRYCKQCGRAKKACLCQWIQTIESSTEVVILQHPSEVNQAKGTAKIIELSVSPCHLFVGEDFSAHSQVNQWLAETDVINILMFPSQESLELTANTFKAKPNCKTRLFLIDGTWKKAFKMYQLSHNLHSLVQVHLPTDIQGRYTIRKAPNDAALSTVEAAYHALTLLNACDASPLITAFDKMIEFQISQLPEGTYDKYFGGRNR